VNGADGDLVKRGAARFSARCAALGFFLVASALHDVRAFPIHGSRTVLPAGSELNEEALQKPREIFKSESSGKSYLINLGDMAFSSPALLGDVARRAGVSCSTCHVNGASNPGFFVPGLSTRHGNVDTTGALFNPAADDHVLNPLTIPSLRGARYLGPYGHDGRLASLRGFVRNVIVDEFGAAEPSAPLLDAIVAYIEDVEFLPNPRITATGRVRGRSTQSVRHGEALFAKPFPQDPSLSCAACHIPSSHFVDHRQHDVGSGGGFKTPTLLNANFNAPYFHDGRFSSYDEVVRHFDRQFSLGLSTADRRDLIAYLTTIGDGERGEEADSIEAWLKEINDFASVLSTAIPAHDRDVIAFTVDTVGTELRELAEHFPDHKDSSVTGGGEQRRRARQALKEAVLSLRRVALASSANDFDTASTEFVSYGELLRSAAVDMNRAQSWSLFDPKIHDAHYDAMRRVADTATAGGTDSSMRARNGGR
jgi:cytochrome c peroxidase